MASRKFYSTLDYTSEPSSSASSRSPAFSPAGRPAKQFFVYINYERFFYPDAAIAREKEIKGWRRSKKINLIASTNPRWDDLAKDWGNVYKPGPEAQPREIPRPAGENAGASG